MNKGVRLSGNPTQTAIQRTLMAAVEHIQAGRLDEAAAMLESGGALRNPVGRNILGDIRLKQGRARDALKAFDAALAMASSFPEAHTNRGVALQALGRLADALAAQDRALRHRPDYATAHYNRGNILRDLERTDEAIAAYGAALKRQPSFPEALVNRGTLLLGKGNDLQALQDFQRAVALRPRYVEAQVGLADAHRRLRRFGEALAAIDAALDIEPGNRTSLLARGGILYAEERFEDALAVTDDLLARDPQDISALLARGHALFKLWRLDEALAAAAAAVKLAPKDYEGHALRAVLLGQLGRFEEQWEALAAAERLGASGFVFNLGRAIALSNAQRFEEAIDAYDRALTDEPNDATCHRYRSFANLAKGNLAEGWQEHEWRIKIRGNSRPDCLNAAPMWAGEDITGKKILLHSEQGHGDTIQFVRYAPLVAGRGARVSLVVHESLRRLFAANFPDMDVGDTLGMRAGFDYQAPLMSLPHILGTTSEAAIPHEVPYLVADEARIAKWRDRLGAHGFRVGINWQGNPVYAADRDRSIALRHFAPLTRVAGVRLISLQAQNGLDQLNDLPAGMTVETLGEEIVSNPDGFREMAAVMANLDLLVTSDSAPAHLAGAMARPVWVALPACADWRWMAGRDDSPWYPTMKLVRQKTLGDWASLFDGVAVALADAAARKAGR